jgi:hypothetical protein
MPKKKQPSVAAPSLAEIIPGKKVRRQIHQSGLMMLSQCGIRFYYRYVLGEKRPPNAFMVVGSATDASVNNNLDNKIDTGQLLPREAVEDFAATAFEKKWDSEPVQTEEGDEIAGQVELTDEEKEEGVSLKRLHDQSKDKTIGLSLVHYDECAPTLSPVATAQKFSLNLDPFLRERAKALHALAEDSATTYDKKRLHAIAAACNSIANDGCDLAGELDIREECKYDANDQELMSTITTIRDTKTSGKSPTKSIYDQVRAGVPLKDIKPGLADTSLQLSIYALAAQVTEGRIPDFVALDYLVETKKKDGSVSNRYYVPTLAKRTLEDVEVDLRRIENFAQVMKTGSFTPADPTWWGCSKKWCGFWERCEFAKKPKLIQIGGV